MSAASSWLRDTLHALTWRHVVATMAVGLCVGVVQVTTTRAIFLLLKDNWEQRSYMFKEFLGFGQLAAFVFLPCLVGADQAVRHGATRRLAYGTAMLVACASTFSRRSCSPVRIADTGVPFLWV